MVLQDKVIIVTGSSNGIGFAIAQNIIDNGGKVILHGRKETDLSGAVAKLGEENVHAVLGDLQDPTVPQTLVDSAIRTFGKLDGIVNNAGVYPRDTIDDFTVENFEFVFNVNVRAPMLLTQAAVKEFRKNSGDYRGTIVNIGSINALGGLSKISTYSASKGALLTFTRNAAKHLAKDKIRINQLNVGWTKTENENATQLAEGNPEDWEDHLDINMCPWGRIWRPEEVAVHVVNMLRDDSGPMTGTMYELEQFPLYGHNFSD